MTFVASSYDFPSRAQEVGWFSTGRNLNKQGLGFPPISGRVHDRSAQGHGISQYFCFISVCSNVVPTNPVPGGRGGHDEMTSPLQEGLWPPSCSTRNGENRSWGRTALLQSVFKKSYGTSSPLAASVGFTFPKSANIRMLQLATILTPTLTQTPFPKKDPEQQCHSSYRRCNFIHNNSIIVVAVVMDAIRFVRHMGGYR